MRDKPNVLLVVVDCARSDKWLGPGRPTRTPNFDRFAAGGTRLSTCIVEKACTTPAFSSLLTGLYSPRHGVHLVWGYRLPERVPMLTESLAGAGYHTYAEVSGPLLPEMGLARGFESYEYRAPCDLLHTAWGDRFVERLRAGHYREPWFILLHLWELHPQRYVAPECDRPEYGRDAYERAISSLDAQLPRLFAAAGEETLIAFTGDHGEKTQFESYQPGTAVEYARTLLGVDRAAGMAPFQVANWAGPSVLQELYGRSTPLMRGVRLRERREAAADVGGTVGAALPDFGRSTRMRDRLRLLKLTPMVWLHDLLALRTPLKLTQMLKRRGLLDAQRAREKVDRLTRGASREQTLDMHMRMWINSYKHNMHEGHLVHVYDFLVNVPLVLRFPASWKQPNIASGSMVRQVDILPTILDLVGAPPHAAGETDGRSLTPLLRGAPWTAAAAFLSVSGTPADLELRGVRTEDYKYTYGPENDELPQELYDLRADPRETRNLAAERPDLCGELRELADSFVQAAAADGLDEMELSQAQHGRVEQQLRELGYIE